MKNNTKHKAMLRKNMGKATERIGFVSIFITGMSLIWPLRPRDYMHATGGGFAEDAKHEVTVNDHETDSPIIQIEKLHAIRPDKVDWIFQQTEKDAEVICCVV